MSSETTPLQAKIQDISDNISVASSAIKEKVKENFPAVDKTNEVIQDKIQEFVEMAKKGTTSIRGLALISGLALVISSVYEILINLFTFQLTFTMIGFYSLVMGSVAIAMEVDPQALPFGEKIRAWLLKYIGLVQLSTGRGVFYLVAGSLELTQSEYSATIIGLFTVAVAIAYISLGRRATMKVQALRAAKYPTSVLRMKFNEFDVDNNGFLDFKEFHQLLLSLEVDITYQGSEMLFVSLDRDMNGNLEFDEFVQFWSNDPLTLVPV